MPRSNILMENWLWMGLVGFGFGYAVLAGLHASLGRTKAILAATLAGTALSLLDMALMWAWWSIEPYWAALVFGAFSYSVAILLWQFERADHNTRILIIATMAMTTTYLENLNVGRLGHVLGGAYPLVWWEFSTTLFYFLGMTTLDFLLYLLILRRLTGDASIRVLVLEDAAATPAD